MKHLVLGSRGQVGQYVVAELQRRGEEVVEWDIKDDANKYDLRISSEAFYLAVEESDFVHFLAYEVGGSKYLAEHQAEYSFISDNIQIMDNVFRVLSVTGKPFYFASSQMSNMFHSVYGRLKAVGEAYTNSLENGRIVHFWNVYGYENDPEKTHVITDFIRQGIREHKILIRTDGSETRNFLYGKDAGKILAEIAMDFDWYKERFKLPIPVTGLEFVCIKYVANEIARQLGGIPVYSTDKKDTVQGMTNDVPYYARDVLGRAGLYNGASANNQFRGTSLDNGIREMIELEVARLMEDTAKLYEPLVKTAKLAELSKFVDEIVDQQLWRRDAKESS